MDTIAKVRADIERLIELNKTKNGFPASFPCEFRIEAYEVLLSVLDTIESEQKPSGCVNVESEYDKGWRDGHKAGLKDAEMQKPAWSEEDKDKLYQVMGTLLADKTVAQRDTPHCKALHEAYDEMLAWLKSIRPSWKPSEEQMAWLKLAIDEAKEPLKSQLEELYKNIRENLIWK